MEAWFESMLVWFALPKFGLSTVFVVAFVSAVIAIRWMVTWLQQRSFAVFGWYRILIGTLAFAWLSAGWL